ncbi:MAG: hypothetical protein MJE68_01565, partial [Proteobacteria bacterium]|nr:hypothetical protein [Pseudomonadota bacterium]
MFPSIPISHAVIDTLHLLKISDVLMNFLLPDLERHDELKKNSISRCVILSSYLICQNFKPSSTLTDCGIPFEMI